MDYSLIRPKGARLKTFGGRASGPGPLQQLCKFTVSTFSQARSRRLHSSELSDIGCMVAQCVVVGGVRRSACIILCNLSDLRMRHYKSGDWRSTHPHRAYANISVAYTERPEADQFLEEWLALMRNGSGERGIINREGIIAGTTRSMGEDCGVNPCGEVLLRKRQFCNLTEVVARPDDTMETLKDKVKAATILGTLQSTLIDFKFLNSDWVNNTKEERLLGVSITGCMDHLSLGYDVISDPSILVELKTVAHATNKKWAKALGIPESKAITCVKPSGTVSQLVNSSSGLHARFAKYYVRRVRVTATDPLCIYMKDAGVPWEPEVGESRDQHTTVVFEFPIEAPVSSEMRDNLSAIDQLEIWLAYKEHWCDHNPSVTIHLKEDEWIEAAAWVYEHWDNIAGLSFLPYDGGNYPLMPYEEIEKDEYDSLRSSFPELDFSNLTHYEETDNTQGSRELACVAGSCEI